MENTGYQEDLAYIHDVGYAEYALQSAPGILETLAQSHISNGLVVELGCGSGLTALALVKAGYQVLGIDISEAMIAIARQRVPSAEFLVESLFRSEIPPCGAVISVGECLNYLFDPVDHWQSLTQLFCRIYTALSVGGVFIFDLLEPGQVEAGKSVKSFTEGSDWIVLVEKEENREKSILTRRIISLRNVGEFYRRSDEIHHQQLYPTATIVQ
jgi:SAM-dependent methyltransferase